jgi:hypothetical protein
MIALAVPLWRFHRDSHDNFSTKVVSNKYEVKHLLINWAIIFIIWPFLEAGSTECMVTSVGCRNLL